VCEYFLKQFGKKSLVQLRLAQVRGSGIEPLERCSGERCSSASRRRGRDARRETRERDKRERQEAARPPAKLDLSIKKYRLSIEHLLTALFHSSSTSPSRSTASR
jgi:hypothetical protein